MVPPEHPIGTYGSARTLPALRILFAGKDEDYRPWL